MTASLEAGERDHAGAATLAFGGAALTVCPSGALWWADEATLVVSDLHLGKAERVARRQGLLLPPYDTAETLSRLRAEIERLTPALVVCLGDSFDDSRAADGLEAEARAELTEMAEGREWVWITGNHDPAPVGLGGTVRTELTLGGIAFRHIAAERPSPTPEVSGHYHPKARLTHLGRRIARPCFAAGNGRLILPAFGCYTGGLDMADPVFGRLLGAEARLWLTGARVIALPRRAVL